MVVAFASTTPLRTGPTPPLLENTWGIVGPGAILIVVGAIESATATAMIIPGTGIGKETVTVTVLRVVTTGTAVTGIRIGTGVIEGAPVAIRLIAGGEEATLVAQPGAAPDALANVTVTVIDPKILVVFCHRLPISGMQVIIISKLSSFETPLPYCIKTSNSSCSVN